MEREGFIPYRLQEFWQRRFIQQKLRNPLGMVVIGVIGGFLALVFYGLGFKLGMSLTGLIVGLPVLVWAFLDLRVGIGLALVTAFLVNFISKYATAPVGTVLDGLLFYLLLSVIVQSGQRRDWQFPRYGIAVMIVIWIGYSGLQVLNPEAASKLAWLYTIRSYSLQSILFFIAFYAFQQRKHIDYILYFIFLLALVAALYGLKQEFFGYSDQEWAWLHAKRSRYKLIVQWDRYRVFSLFSDPTTFGTLMAYLGAFCFVMATGPFQWWKRIGLVLTGGVMYLSMAYAGSRTPFVLIPAAIFLFVLLNLRPKVIIAAAILGVIGIGFLKTSTSNPILIRIQSAFWPAHDASVQVRLENQKRIQPYLQSHPFGAGLGSTGIWGERFSPDSWLAGFAHDSAYVRIAVEMGAIGLVIYLMFLFFIFWTTIHYYFRVRDPVIKTIYLAFTIMIFMIALASYPQEVVTLQPTSIIFYTTLAIIVRLKDFDTPQNKADQL